MDKKKILICGASGFIGRNIAESFSASGGAELYGTYFKSAPPQVPGVKMLKADLTSRQDVESAIKGMDIIIQAAATTSGARDIINKPYYHVTDNAVMNSLILRAVYEHKASHFVFFSCSVMYQPCGRPVKEEDFDPRQEIFPSYFGVGWTKVYIEKMCEFYSRIGQAKITVIRHSNIYGPYDKFDLERSHVFGATMTKVMTAAQGGEISIWGSGEEERDLLYVSDLCDFVKLAVDRQKEKFGLYNVGSGSAVSVNTLVDRIISASGKGLGTRHELNKPTIKTKLCLDTARARAAFGWEPKISLDQGIRKTMDWYRENLMKDKVAREAV